ncbi:hypothetical protein AB6A23_23110 [Paenibacillus tarimensis]
MRQKYLRIQVRYCGKTGKPVGIFGACWHLLRGTMRSNCLNEEEKALFLAIEDWFVRHLPEPPFYEDGNQMKAITWFKTEKSAEMIERLGPLMDLLDKYGVAYDVVYTNVVGHIVYEDQWQVGVV